VLHRIAFPVVSKWCQEFVVYASLVTMHARSATRIFSTRSMRGYGWGRAARSRASSHSTASATCTLLVVFIFINVEPRRFGPQTSAEQSR
jgi:hypothetical protein